MMLALLEMAQSAMPQRATKTTGPNTKQGTQRVFIPTLYKHLKKTTPKVCGKI